MSTSTPTSTAMTRRTTLAAIWILPSALLLALATWVHGTYRISVPPPLSAQAHTTTLGTLRAALQGNLPGDAPAALARRLPGDGPVVVSLLERGQIRARVVAHAPTLAEAVGQAAAMLAAHPQVRALSPVRRAHARIKVDVVVGRGPMATGNTLARAVGIHPGLEGLGVTLEGPQAQVPGGRAEALLLPDELFLQRLFGSAQPLSFVPDFTIGLDFERADMLLAKLAALPPGGYGAARRTYFRFRTDSFVERPRETRDQAPPLPLTRGLPPAPPVTAESLRAAALAGGAYLVAHLSERGRYVYERDLSTGQGTDPDRPGPYSIPRHAGTTYFLAELYRITGEASLREPIERAFAHLQELVEAGGCAGTLPGGARFACVIDRGQTVADLGSTALTVVALAEYQRATGDARYQELAAALSAWILSMQRPDGSFAHLYDVPQARRDEHTELFYYSGEAALALARMHVVTGEARYRDAAERALDSLVGWYDFFAGGFFYGEEHWTCIAAEAAYPAIQKDSYRRFCSGYGAFLRNQQAGPGEASDQADYAGSYNLTPFLIPYNTPAGSRTEAMISAYLLGQHHGQPDPRLRRQVLAAAQYALGQQIRPESDFSVAARVPGIGAVPASPVDRRVRIDYVQHVCSALIRAVELVESPSH